MYDFSKQKAMLEVTLELLKENSLLEISSLGGGTALAGYYWNHRYSTDIDIFIYGNENKTQLLKPSDWSENIKSKKTGKEFIQVIQAKKLKNSYLRKQ